MAVNSEKAKKIYATLISMLDSKEWHYDRHDDDLVIKSGVVGDDLPIEFIVAVKEQSEVVQFLSKLPFHISEDKRIDGAIAVCVANNGLNDGSFDYDVTDGTIIFRLTTSYRGSDTINEDLFTYIIGISAGTVDKYNDRFLALSTGNMSLQDFIAKENQ